MKVKQVREDIQSASEKILSKLQFTPAKDGSFQKHEENGDVFSILFSEVKDSNSFSISVRVSVNYSDMTKIFPKTDIDPEYMLTERLGSESISYEEYNIKRLSDVLSHLTTSFAQPYLSQVSSIERVFNSLSSDDSGKWVTSNIITRFKFRFALAVFKKDADLLSEYLAESDKALSKPWASQYNIQLTSLIDRVKACM